MIFNKEKKLQTCMYHVFHYSFKRLPVEKLMYGSEVRKYQDNILQLRL